MFGCLSWAGLTMVHRLQLVLLSFSKALHGGASNYQSLCLLSGSKFSLDGEWFLEHPSTRSTGLHVLPFHEVWEKKPLPFTMAVLPLCHQDKAFTGAASDQCPYRFYMGRGASPDLGFSPKGPLEQPSALS